MVTGGGVPAGPTVAPLSPAGVGALAPVLVRKIRWGVGEELVPVVHASRTKRIPATEIATRSLTETSQNLCDPQGAPVPAVHALVARHTRAALLHVPDEEPMRALRRK